MGLLMPINVRLLCPHSRREPCAARDSSLALASEQQQQRVQQVRQQRGARAPSASIRGQGAPCRRGRHRPAITRARWTRTHGARRARRRRRRAARQYVLRAVCRQEAAFPANLNHSGLQNAQSSGHSSRVSSSKLSPSTRRTQSCTNVCTASRRTTAPTCVLLSLSRSSLVAPATCS